MRVDVDDAQAVVVDGQAARAGDLADHGRLDVPLAGDGQERVELVGPDHGHHPLLRLRHEDLAGRERGVAQQHVLEVDVHAAVAVGGQLAGGAGDAGGAQVLDALDHARGVELEAALDEHLLHERVAHLHRRALGGLGVVERLAGEDRGAADAVATGPGAEQDDLVARAGRVGQVDVLVPQHAEAQRVDQRVALVGRVEDELAADVGQAERVAVAADAGHHAVHHAGGVGVVDGAEPQLVHDGDRARAHRDDVAHDAADAGGRALVRLDVGRVVVRLDLEGHRPAVADVDDARVLADADEQVLLHGVGGLVAELAQVVLARLVRAVLRPHDRVHGELGGRGAAPEDVADALVLVRLEAQLGERLLLVGGRGGDVDGVGLGGARRCGGHRFPRWRPVALRHHHGSAADVGRRGSGYRGAEVARRSVQDPPRPGSDEQFGPISWARAPRATTGTDQHGRAVERAAPARRPGRCRVPPSCAVRPAV